MFYNVSLDKPTKQNVLGLFGHGALATPYVELDERQLVQAALHQLDLMYNGAASRSYQKHLLQNWSKSPFHYGTYSYFSLGAPSTLGAPIDGRIHFAGEAYYQRWDGEWGYMHVAARTAYDVAQEISS